MTAIAAAVALLSVFVNAQPTAQIESNLLAKIKKIGKASAYTSAERNDDLLDKLNADFKANLLKYTRLPATLRYNFSKLSKEIDIATSADKRFRVYTWDRQDGGTMHFFEAVYQFMADDGKVYSNGNVYSKTAKVGEDGDAGGFVTDVFSLDTKNGRVYMVCTSSILSTSEMAQSIDLFKVRGNSLDGKVKLIKTSEHLTNTLGFEYDFFSVVDRPERPIKLISYDAATKSIKLPVVIVEDKFQYGRVTDKFITYRFNGTHFVKVS